MSRLLIWITLFGVTAPLFAQAPASPSINSDASWIRNFALSVSNSEKRRENQLNGDPRFEALLRSSFHQRQFFWRDHGRFTPLPDLVQLFIGVPGNVVLDQKRYVTINGCVPHDCGNRGMVWVDSAPAPTTTVIFAANNQVSELSASPESPMHLWIFSSTPLNWQKLPAPFLASFASWWNRTTQPWSAFAPEKVVLVTLVQPNGEMIDLVPSGFGFVEPTKGRKAQ